MNPKLLILNDILLIRKKVVLRVTQVFLPEAAMFWYSWKAWNDLRTHKWFIVSINFVMKIISIMLSVVSIWPHSHTQHEMTLSYNWNVGIFNWNGIRLWNFFNKKQQEKRKCFSWLEIYRYLSLLLEYMFKIIDKYSIDNIFERIISGHFRFWIFTLVAPLKEWNEIHLL